MLVVGDFVTVGALLAALTDVDPDTPVVVATGTGQYLWITEITLDAMEERYRVDEAVIALGAEYVVLTVEPPKPRGPPVTLGSPVDFSARVRCVDGAVALDYAAAVYLLALVDVLERLATSRYGAPPRPPFGEFREALNAAARELASASRPAGICADASDDDEGPTLVVSASMSTKEAAEMLEITPAGVTHLVRHGRLEATKFGRQWAVSAASVAAYRASRTPRLKRGEVA